MAVAVDDHHVARRHRRVPDHLVRGRGTVGNEKQVIAVEDARGIALRSRDRARVVKQLAQFVNRIADVRAQQVLAEKLVEHLADRAFQESDAAGVSRAVPGIGAVLRVVGQRAEKRRRQAVEVRLGFAHDVTRDELRRVLEHVDETVQFAQHVVRDVARGLGFAVEKNRNLGVAETDRLDEGAQLADGRFQLLRREIIVVDGEDERRSPRLLLREGRQVAVAGDTQHLVPLVLQRLRQRADAEAAGILRAEILVDDDDRKTEAHGVPILRRNSAAAEGFSGDPGLRCS
jgi:hypothetical protein